MKVFTSKGFPAIQIMNSWFILFCVFCVQLFECQTPLPMNLLEAYVVENEEYPIVVLGVKERSVLYTQHTVISELQ